MHRTRSASALRVALAALFATACVALGLAFAGPAGAVSLTGKDGRIHACFKVKGKAKGTLRVVRSAKVKCPRGFKKTAWNAEGPSGTNGPTGEAGTNGSGGELGAAGNNGTSGTGATSTTAKVTSLETQVSELLAKVKSLEAVLKGVTPAQLQQALAAVPLVGQLCDQAKALNEQSTALTSTLSTATALLKVLVPGLPAVPASLPAFSCS